MDKLVDYLKNVIWYHYKYYVLAILVFGVLAISLSLQTANSENYDTSYVIAGDFYMDEETIQKLSNEIFAGEADMNGDEKFLSHGDSLIISPKSDEVSIANAQRLTITMMEDSIALYIFDKPLAEGYAADGSLEYYVDISNSKILKKLGISYESGLYAALKVITPQRKNNPDIYKQYELAMRAIERLKE